jgi:hypothetical protein
MGKDQPHRIPQRALPCIGCIQIETAVAVDIAQSNHHHPSARPQRWLEQGSMERLDLGAISRCALRENGHVVAACQRLDNGAIGARRVLPFLALDENRSRTRYQEAHDGPAPDVRLRHETHWDYRIQHPDIKPGDVIAHD